MRPSLWLVFIACGAGCFSDLTGFARDLAMSGDDDGGLVVDLRAATDGSSSTDLATVDKTCALPHLQILVRDGRSTSGLVKHGSVLRLPLDGRPPCEPLVLANSLTADNTTLGFIPPSTTVYGEADGRLRFIAADDTEAQAPYDPGDTQSPDYVFALTDPDGTRRVAIAYDSTNDPQLGTTAISRVDVLDPLDWSQRTDRWTLGTDPDDLLRTSAVMALAADPRVADAVVAFRFASPTYPTVSLAAPFAGTASMPAVWVENLDNDGRPKRLRTWNRRAVWVYQAPSFAPGRDDMVVHRTEPETGSPTQWGPMTCVDRMLCSAPLHLYDAIPDPSDSNAVLALCEVDESDVTGEDTSHLIRIAADGTCETLFRGDTLPANHYLTHLVPAVDDP